MAFYLDSALELKIISDFGSHPELDAQWDKLAKACAAPSIFVTRRWQKNWWEHYGNNKELHIVSLWRGNELVALLPMYHRIGGIRQRLLGLRYFLVGYGERVCPEYLGLIVREEDIGPAVDIIAEHLQTGNHRPHLFFEDVLVKDRGTSALVERLRKKSTVCCYVSEPRYYIPLPSSYDGFLMTLSKRNRAKKRGRLHKAFRDNEVRLELMQANTIEAWLPVMTELSNMARARKGNKSPFFDLNYRRFHKSLLKDLLPLKQAAVFFLYYNEKPVAFIYLLNYMKASFAYQTGFNPSIESSPGDVVLQLSLSNLIKSGFEEFDFLRGGHGYKRFYTKSYKDTEDVYIFGNKGLFYYLTRLKKDYMSHIKLFLKQGIRLGRL